MSTETASKTYSFTKSEEVFKEAQTLMPGGVSSPVRAFKSVGGNPVVFDKVKGAYAWDVDGEWRDLVFVFCVVGFDESGILF